MAKSATHSTRLGTYGGPFQEYGAFTGKSSIAALVGTVLTAQTWSKTETDDETWKKVHPVAAMWSKAEPSNQTWSSA